MCSWHVSFHLVSSERHPAHALQYLSTMTAQVQKKSEQLEDLFLRLTPKPN